MTEALTAELLKAGPADALNPAPRQPAGAQPR